MDIDFSYYFRVQFLFLGYMFERSFFQAGEKKEYGNLWKSELVS